MVTFYMASMNAFKDDEYTLVQHWFQQWPGAVRQQAITQTRAHPDYALPNGLNRS